jgi:hypothetical protein
MTEQTNTAQPDAVPTQSDETQDRTAGTQDAPLNLTQDALNSLIANERRKERQRIASQYGDLDELKALKQAEEDRKAAEMSEIEKLNAQLADMQTKQQAAEQKAQQAELNALRLRVGHELGVPPVLSARLSGQDEEAIRADANALLEALKTDAPAARIPNLDATAGMGSITAPTVKLTPGQQAAARAAGLTDEQYAESLKAVEGM